MSATYLDWTNTENAMPTTDEACLVMVNAVPPKIHPHLYCWNGTIWECADGDYFDYCRPEQVLAWCSVGKTDKVLK